VTADAPPFALVDAVSKSFSSGGRRPPVVALQPVSCAVKAGELVALLGPSGCGKTTLLRMVAGLTRPTTGRVLVRGQEVRGPGADFGFVFQAPTLLPWRSVLGNILFPMEILGRADHAARDRANELLGIVGLRDFAKHRPHELSGGMRQRVALCRALIHAPSLLLMDEPFAALDELTRMEMHDLLLDIRARTGATVLFVTHGISEAVFLADEILVFSPRPGRIAARIRVDLGYPRTPDMRYGAAFAALARQAGAALGIVHADA
jgi:NitT/TauT family transport system ATP-binding protein